MTSRQIRATASLALAIAMINALLGIHRWLPDPRFLTVVGPTLESFIAVLAVVLVVRTGMKRPGWVHWPVSVVIAALVLFGIGEGFYRAIFREGFVPWTDLGFISPLLNMVFNTAAFARPALTAIPVVLLVLAVAAAIYGLTRWADHAARKLPAPNISIVVAAFAILAIPGLLRGIDTPLAVTAARQLRPPVTAVEESAALAEVADAPKQSVEEFHFAGLRDRDIHLFIVESYGHTLFSNEAHRPLISPVYDRIGAELESAGLDVYSAFLVSPAFGGRSWLADASILTGTFVESQHAYDRIVEMTLRNLSHILGEAGYHRVLAAPGTYEADDPWRAFYEFDQYLFRYDFDYAGPFISFGAMPDQFLMYRTHELVPDNGKPLFVNYILVSSHVPFDRLPQYVDDWTALGDGGIFNELPLREFDNNWLTGGEYPEGYVASIEYTLTAVTRFITEVVADDSLFIVVGDHQPRIPISEQSATFSVPVHVISTDSDLVSGFARFGFTPGTRPDETRPHAGMDELLGMLLTVSHARDRLAERLPE